MNGVEKIIIIGDAYMVVAIIQIANATHAFEVVNAELEIQQFMKEHETKKWHPENCILISELVYTKDRWSKE